MPLPGGYGGVHLKTEDSLLQTGDVLLKTKDGLMKTEDNRKWAQVNQTHFVPLLATRCIYQEGHLSSGQLDPT